MALRSVIASARDILLLDNSVGPDLQAELDEIKSALQNLEDSAKNDRSGVTRRIFMCYYVWFDDYQVLRELDLFSRFNYRVEYSNKGMTQTPPKSMVRDLIKSFKDYNLALVTTLTLLDT